MKYYMCALGCALCVLGGVLPAVADNAYGIRITGVVFDVDFENVTVTELFDTGMGGNFYGATDGDTVSSFFAVQEGGDLYGIDVVSQAATLIGASGGPNIQELAYDEARDILYGTDLSSLYTIDTSSGAAALVGSFGGPTTVWAMDYDPALDKLIAVQTFNPGAMYYVDTDTGAATFVGETGLSRISDIWYDAVSSQMYGVSSVPNTLFTLDTLTGAGTTLGDIGVSNIHGLGVPIPEPATLSILVLGGLVALGRRRA